MKNIDICGFTLIELLVVVLIIGILAAVALPQYEKAVKKSRLAQLSVIADAAKKNMDLYVLENGYETITFTEDDLSIQMPGEWSSDGLKTPLGDARLECNASGYCLFWFKGFPSTVYAEVALVKGRDSKEWTAEGLGGDNDIDIAILCQWTKGNGYPANGADVFNTCKNVGVTLEKAY